MSLFCWKQRKIFWRMWETEPFWAPLTSIVFISYYGSQLCPKTACLQTFFKISSFVFIRTNKFIQVWNYLRVSKRWQILFFFCVNYPFKTGFVLRVTKWHILCKGHSYPLQLEMLRGWWPDWLLWVTSLLWKPSQNLLALYQPEGKTSTRGLEHLRQCYFVEVIEVCVLKGKWKKLASKSFWMKLKSRYWFVIYLPPLTTDDQVPPEGLLRVGGGAETSTDAPWDI